VPCPALPAPHPPSMAASPGLPRAQQSCLYPSVHTAHRVHPNMSRVLVNSLDGGPGGGRWHVPLGEEVGQDRHTPLSSHASPIHWNPRALTLASHMARQSWFYLPLTTYLHITYAPRTRVLAEPS
jgi:hypothetical protein